MNEPTDACLYKLPQGKIHSLYARRKYELCITRNQHNRLFGGGYVGNIPIKPKKLGCGVFGCVYAHPIDPKKAVKITRDLTDADGLQHMTDRGRHEAVRVYEHYELKQGARWKKLRKWDKADPTFPIRALVVERAKKVVPNRSFHLWQNSVVCINESQASGVGLRRTQEVCCAGEIQPDYDVGVGPYKSATGKHCKTLAEDLPKIEEAAADEGLNWTDAHAANIGIGQDGRWKILDLGLTGFAAKEKPPVLEGARGRLAYRKR
jgi:hypothetical protein